MCFKLGNKTKITEVKVKLNATQRHVCHVSMLIPLLPLALADKVVPKAKNMWIQTTHDFPLWRQSLSNGRDTGGVAKSSFARLFPVRQLFWRACIQTSPQKNHGLMSAKLSNSIHQRIVIFIISTSPVVGVTCVLFELFNNTISVLVWLMFFVAWTRVGMFVMRCDLCDSHKNELSVQHIGPNIQICIDANWCQLLHLSFPIF